MKKKEPKNLYTKQMELSPEAHKLKIAMSMCGVHTDIPSCAVIVEMQKAMKKMGGKFDLETASKIQWEVTKKFEALKEDKE